MEGNCLRCGKQRAKANIKGGYETGAFALDICMDCYFKCVNFIIWKKEEESGK